MTVPFFGDQAFWGEMCRRAGVGPAPVAIEKLTVQRLLDGLAMLMKPSVSASSYEPLLRAMRNIKDVQVLYDVHCRFWRATPYEPCMVSFLVNLALVDFTVSSLRSSVLLT